MKIWIVSRKTATINFKFQIRDPQNIKTYHMCQYSLTTQKHPCRRKLETHVFVMHAFTYLWKNYIANSIYVVSIVVFKFQKVHIYDSTKFDSIFDGPTTEYKKVPVGKDNNLDLVLSSFQATVLVTDLKFLFAKQVTDYWYYDGKDEITDFYYSSDFGHKLVFNKSCYEVNCMVHEAYWLGPWYSVNITVINAAYSGPREPVTTHYAGISIYEYERRGYTYYEDHIMFEPFPILTISPDNTMDLNLKNFSCVNNPSAELCDYCLLLLSTV